LGDIAAPAVPALLEVAAKDPSASTAVLDALTQIGEPAVPQILATVERADPAAITAEHWAAKCLTQMGGIATAATVQSLSHASANVRLLATLILMELGPDAESAGPRLMERLDDGDARVRAAALRAVVAVGMPIQHVRPRLKSAFSDPLPGLRTAAIEAAIRLSESEKEFHGEILAALKDGDESVRRTALAALGDRFADAVPALVEMLKDEKQRTAVVEALGHIGPSAKPAVPQLVALLGQGGKEQKLPVFAALGRIGPAAIEARTVLESARKDGDPAVRAAAIETTGLIEADAGRRIAALSAGLDDADISVRRSAASAIGRLKENGLDAAPKLIALLQSDGDRDFALAAIQQLPIRDVAALVGLLNHAQRDVRMTACERLGRLGKDAKEATSTLGPLTRDADQELARAASRALRAIDRK
jgi:HEAT repeat protein